MFDAWLFVANYTKLGKFVLLKRFVLKIDIFGRDLWARTSTAFSLIFKRLLIQVCRFRTVYSTVNQNMQYAKRDIESWLSKTKNSPLRELNLDPHVYRL